MTCPAENTWLGYLAGRLEDPSFQAVERHLDGCPSCQLLYAGLARRDGEVGPAVAPVVAGRALAAGRALDLAPGTRVGRYLILGPLGRGGMGVVYRAFDPELDRPIALKLVGLAGLGPGAEQAGLRLQREARTLARLSHPNVVAVHDAGSFEEHVFVAMEFVAGVHLRSWLAARERRPRDIIAVFLAAGAGLAAAHRIGIVHRDFKPENVMVSEDGRVRVLDFGLARSVASALSMSPPGAFPAGAPDAHVTVEGAIAGTPAYMAPEQDAGDKVDARSDQYSFCAALHEALYGRLPYRGGTYVELAAARRAGGVEAPPLRGVSGRVRRALETGLAVLPADRHRDMDALLAELGAQRWTRRRIAAIALALVAVAGGTAGWVVLRAPAGVAATCGRASAEVDKVWNPTRRAAVVASLSQAGGSALADRVAAGVDRWAREWARERREVCASTVRGAPDRDEHAGDRVQCLERRLTTTDAVLHVFTDALEPAIAARATAIVDDLPPPSGCAALSRPAISDQQKEMWKPSIRDLVQAQLALSRGQAAEAARLAGVVVERSRETRQKEPLAAALLLRGKAELVSGDLVGGRATLREAILAAAEVDEDGFVVDAWLDIVQSLAFREKRFDHELEQAIFGAELAVRRLPVDDPDTDARRAGLAYSVGSARLLQGDSDAAIDQLHDAMLGWTRAGADKHRLDIAAVENSLGMAYSNRAEWATSRRYFDRALATWQKLGGDNPNIGVTTGNIGSLLARQRLDEEAVPVFQRALAALEAAGDAGRPHLPDTLVQLARVEVRMGRCDRADGHLARAREIATSLHGADSGLVGVTLTGIGECQLARGRVREAIATLERARALVATYPASLSLRADADFALARALWQSGQRARARTLAGSARSGLAAIAGARASLREVEAWLATRGGG
ncbi:MAG TPA: serine/threonine-protein kinase [Kofleriaceae bacterium]|nr:serine/threonine-protein kinase [Kofleriaceae bacterium]